MRVTINSLRKQLRALKAESRQLLAERDATIVALTSMRDDYRDATHKQTIALTTAERALSNATWRHKEAETEWREMAARDAAEREVNAATLLAAENRVCELEAALVSLAVRVA